MLLLVISMCKLELFLGVTKWATWSSFKKKKKSDLTKRPGYPYPYTPQSLPIPGEVRDKRWNQVSRGGRGKGKLQWLLFALPQTPWKECWRPYDNKYNIPIPNLANIPSFEILFNLLGYMIINHRAMDIDASCQLYRAWQKWKSAWHFDSSAEKGVLG